MAALSQSPNVDFFSTCFKHLEKMPILANPLNGNVAKFTE
jgi:hypothetical protein